MAATTQPTSQPEKGNVTIMIRGCVTDHVTMLPVAGVKVTVAGAVVTTLTRADGTFYLHLSEQYRNKSISLVATKTELTAGIPEDAVFPELTLVINDSLLQSDITLYCYPQQAEDMVLFQAYRKPIVTGELGDATVITGGIRTEYRNEHRTLVGNFLRGIGRWFKKK